MSGTVCYCAAVYNLQLPFYVYILLNGVTMLVLKAASGNVLLE